MDNIGIHGIITIHEIPGWWTDADFKHYWCPETDASGRVVRPSRISEGEKRSRIVPLADGRMCAENLITNAGIALILNNLSVAGQGNMQAFAQILAVGNGAISGVTRADTTIAGDGFASGSRKVPASFSITGFTTTITTNFASGDAVGTWTNISLVGFKVSGAQNATTTTATGSPMTHSLFSFVKGASAYALNYVFLLSN